MDYKEAWKDIKMTLQLSLLVGDSGLFDVDDDGSDQTVKAVLEMMKDCEKSIGEEGK